MIIRSETPQDYAVIADINTRAFAEQSGVGVIPSLSRHRNLFDPDLSLVAEDDQGNVVGHALFSPVNIRLMGESLRVVALGPIAVDPPAQRTGVGGALIERGHELARAKGYSFCFLLGHPSYYPRLGYLTHAHGASTCKIQTGDLPESDLTVRKLAESDIPAVRDLWLHEEANVDFAVDAGSQFIEWVSPNPAITASVYLKNDQVVGFTRIHRDKLRSPSVFFARDPESARKMARIIGGGEVVDLPLHPLSASVGAFPNAEVSAQTWEAAMVYPLQPSLFETYYEQVKAGKRASGRVIWMVAFDIA